MLKEPEFRKSIVIGVITSLIVLILIDPLFKLLLRLVLWLGDHAWQGLTNGIYTSAAIGSTQKYSFLTLFFGFLSIQMATTFLALRTVRKIRNIQQSLSGTVDQPSINKKKLVEITRKVRIATYFLLPTTYLLGVWLLFSLFAEFQISASFEQRLTVLAASVGDQEVKELRANWALMKTQNDHDALIVRMTDLAAAAGITLPKALW